MRVRRVGYVGTRTDDVAAMTSFFRDVIGLEGAGEGETVTIQRLPTHRRDLRPWPRLCSVTTAEVPPLPRPGFIDHIGIGVPDLAAAREYYDDLMAVLGLREWFATGPEGPLNYGPDGAHGSQLFLYQADEPGTYSRSRTGLHHLAFLVASRAVVREAHQWARARKAVILDEPGEFPQYGEHCFATYWLDPHGFKLEAVCHTPEES